MKRIVGLFKGSMLATLLLIIVIMANMTAITGVVQGYIEEEAITTLWGNVDNLTNDIVRVAKNDTELLENISRIIGKQEEIDSSQVRHILASVEGQGMMSELYLLLPDNRLIEQSGKYVSNKTGLSFDLEKEKGAYISGRQECFADIEEELLYQSVPVSKGGEIQAVLYGVVKLYHLADIYEVNCFSGQGQMYLVEGISGEFLLDTWHKSLANMSSLGDRKVKRGYNREGPREDFLQGKKGMTVFLSQTSGEYFYYCYQPAGINDWMVAMTVPESAVFSRFKNLRYTLWFFTALEAVVIMIYLAWTLWHKKKEEIEREAELSQVNYIFGIQKILFDVHQRPERMREALGEVGQKLQAETVFFSATQEDGKNNTYSWSAENAMAPFFENNSAELKKELERSKSYVLYDREKIKEIQPEIYGKLLRQNIYNIMLTKIKGNDGKTAGFLGAWNMSHQWKDARYLECVGMNFFLAYKNIRNQKAMGELASVDLLTGLLNRNSHELALKRYEQGKKSPVACIYIDVNGLHEVNNCLGHSAGDEMLRFIAEAVQRIFGREDTYRIGGDEFVAFVFDETKEKTEEKIRLLTERVESKEYHISIGLEYHDGVCSMERMVAAAEQKMYQDKKFYYKTHKNVGKEREMNRKLEEILLEKKDADVFLSFLAPRFLGVYIVDLNRGTSRDIYIPDYFEELLEKRNGSFPEAFDDYIRELIVEEQQEDFRRELDYATLEQRIEQQDALEFAYEKKDGSRMLLYIYKSAGYGEKEKETVWIFEKEESRR